MFTRIQNPSLVSKLLFEFEFETLFPNQFRIQIRYLVSDLLSEFEFEVPFPDSIVYRKTHGLEVYCFVVLFLNVD